MTFKSRHPTRQFQNHLQIISHFLLFWWEKRHIAAWHILNFLLSKVYCSLSWWLNMDCEYGAVISFPDIRKGSPNKPAMKNQVTGKSVIPNIWDAREDCAIFVIHWEFLISCSCLVVLTWLDQWPAEWVPYILFRPFGQFALFECLILSVWFHLIVRLRVSIS